MAIESITISFLGVDERSKSAYQFFFEKSKQPRCVLIDDYRKAQLCLVDIDSYNVQQQYEALIKNYPDKYILVLSILEHSRVHNKEYFLKKPVNSDALQKLLNQISGLVSAKSVIDKSTSELSQAIPFQNAKTQTVLAVQNTPKNIKFDSDTKTFKGPVKYAGHVHDNVVASIKKTRNISPINAGKQVKVEHEEHIVGNQYELDATDQEQLKRFFYAPDKLLQTIVEQACNKSRQNKQIVQLKLLDYFFYFDAHEHQVYSTVSKSIIRSLCNMPHDGRVSYNLKDNSFRDKLHLIFQKNKTSKKTLKIQSWNMESFIWFIALWSSRGRVPQGTDLTLPVYLKQWPNLTRLATIPHAVRVAALLNERPHLLIDVANQLCIDQHYVFAFFSACKAIGLANTTRRQVDKRFVAEKPEHHKNKSILSKLLERLVSSSDKSSMDKKLIRTDE